MSEPQPAQSIVVGIDGSKAAVNAAQWAVAEAGSRNAALRLVHVIEEGADTARTTGPDLDLGYAETVLRAADAALDTGPATVKVETAIVRGAAGRSLLDESHSAAMVCVGSVGIGRFSRTLFGSTAATLASGAGCPVAIIRGGPAAPAGGWIAVTVDDVPGNDVLLDHAFREAQLRDAPILALEAHPWRRGSLLDRHLAHSASRYPDVRLRITPVQRGITEFLSETDELIALAVVAAAEADRIGRIVGPVSRDGIGPAGRSVLVVRG